MVGARRWLTNPACRCAPWHEAYGALNCQAQRGGDVSGRRRGAGARMSDQQREIHWQVYLVPGEAALFDGMPSLHLAATAKPETVEPPRKVALKHPPITQCRWHAGMAPLYGRGNITPGMTQLGVLMMATGAGLDNVACSRP